MPVIFLMVIIIGLATAAVFFVRGQREHAARKWQQERRTVLLKILVPKNNEKTPLAAENLFAALHGIYRPDIRFNEYLSLEIIAQNNAIEFYVQCPTDLREFIEGQIYAQYPNVEILEVTDYARVDLADRKVAAAELSLNKPDVFPIKTFQNFEVDPLAGITAVLSHTADNESMWIQILIRPISDSWQNKALAYAAAARNGNLRSGNWFLFFFRTLFDIFRTPSSAGSGGTDTKLPANHEQAIKAVEEKATKLGYATKIRILVLSPNVAAVAKVNAIGSAYKQFNTMNTNGFNISKITTDLEAIETYRLRRFAPKEGNILNLEELASIFHFPNISVETPNIVWAGAKKGEPPAGLPIEGVATPADLTLFGMTDFRGVRQRFGIMVKDRRQHMYAIGKSGTGKSTMLENMAIDDIRKGRGLAIVDPHGDFVNHILDFIPAERINDVIYFNPADRDHPVGFNLLENVDPALKNIVSSGVVGIFKKLFAESWGPRLEYILRNVILALLEYPNATMLDIMRLLVDKRFRAHVLEQVKDPVIRDFFINEYEKYDPKFRTEAVAPIQNKVGQFLSASTIRNIVGQTKSTFDIEDSMNNRKILLFDLSIGKIGEDTAALLGSMMITKIQLASMRRSNIEDPEKRIDFYLYVDEFQNFATDSFATILSEARKYRLNLILTHQYIAQLPEEVAKAVFGNAGTLVSFRVGASDAVALVKEFEPVFDANDLVNLDNHHIYAKMSIDGVTRPAFSAVTLAPASEKNEHKEKIIQISRERYARPRVNVEQSIAESGLAGSESAVVVSAPGEIAGLTPGAITRAPAIVGVGDESKPTLALAGHPVRTSQDAQGRHWYFVDRSQGSEVPDSKIEDPRSKDRDKSQNSIPNKSSVESQELPLKDLSLLTDKSAVGESSGQETTRQPANGPIDNQASSTKEATQNVPELKDEIRNLSPNETVVLRD